MLYQSNDEMATPNLPFVSEGFPLWGMGTSPDPFRRAPDRLAVKIGFVLIGIALLFVSH